MNIVTCFKELVGEKVLSFSNDDNVRFGHRALEVQQTYPMNASWFCNTYASRGSGYRLLDDPIFASLKDECLREAQEFAKEFDVQEPLECNGGWINVASHGAFQEFHDHERSHFSSVYYIQAAPNSGNIIFKSHAGLSNMFSLPRHDTNEANFLHYYFEPVPSKLLIFRSNLQHMVSINNSFHPRIGVSFNYVVKE